ncbi:MAG TPA: hypothetical protein VMZ28_14945 [Kofleriaceae bacterium]|nr:hypothetical protein [Kofleriaceae bacterium]
MSSRLATVLPLPLLLLAGCELLPGHHHGRRADADGGAGPGDLPDGQADDSDANPPAPAGCGWTFTEVPVLGGVLLDTAPVTVGRSARFRIDVAGCPADLPGPWSAGFTLENEFLVISASVWRAGDDCAAPVTVTRDVWVSFPYAATWSFGDVDIPVGAAPGGACGSDPPSACERDCDCDSGELCLSGDDDARRCAQPCELSRECMGDGRCGDGGGGGLASVCLRDLPECDADHACPDGFACDAGSCAPTFTLSAATRHACDCDTDCDGGMRCVELPATVDSPAHRSCEAICRTENDGWCQGPHTCNASASVEYDLGVCGWVGE